MATDSLISEAANSEVANTTRRQKTACAHLTLELWNLSQLGVFPSTFWPGAWDRGLLFIIPSYIHIHPQTDFSRPLGHATSNPPQERKHNSSKNLRIDTRRKKPLKSTSSNSAQLNSVQKPEHPRLTSHLQRTGAGGILIYTFGRASRPADVLLVC